MSAGIGCNRKVAKALGALTFRAVGQSLRLTHSLF
jgi:hypothetical protein